MEKEEASLQGIHERWMRQALEEADKAEQLNEVPIGAIIVKDQQIIGRGYNVRETQHQATGHAEIQAIEDANRHQQAWRLEGATMYVTLEPCPMCAGALINSRIQTVVYGASDLKAGCAGTLMNLLQDDRFNHQVEVISGVLAEECGDKLSYFFRKLRLRKGKNINRAE
ncbi:tRNA adenosine(34) deaminase TadA [Falseniella ignava]|uniref:tRNA-specific adenosine deaminase n=1 Tax=Falseniella ignava TaxID=137730 RepID=A0A2I1K499_9LACT|nr:tRNA adenosine(34) deaminase TadA [Falseniella ignava]PKY90479.1 tRNA adenosine(34) deaminase TadA [Falseniella ignava]